MSHRRREGEAPPSRYDAQLPPERTPPFLLVPGAGGRATLITPFAKRERGLSDPQRAMIDDLVRRLPGALPAAPFWIDAETGATSRLGPVEDAWMRRKLADMVAVELDARH